jgi:putative intracellular protease/amidase
MSILRTLLSAFRRSRGDERPPVLSASLAVECLEERSLLSANPAIGMNLERVADYMAAWMFTDAFKESRPWMREIYNTSTHTLTQDTSGVLPLHLDPHGWPTQLSQGVNAQGQVLQQVLDTVMFDGLSGHYAAGTYTAEWQGDGTLQWGGDVRVTATGTRANGTHYALLSDTPGNAGILMRITSVNAANPLHDFHVWMPDYNGRSFVGQVWQPGASFSPFHPLFLERLAPFHTLRFMQDEEINSSQIQHWSGRRGVDYETQMTAAYSFQNGMAPEYMIELANELNADLWVNIPHMAEDDYVRNLATMVRDHLRPDRKVYLEWSNEVWNGAPGYLANQWVRQQLTLPENAGVTFEQFVARENRHVFDLWSNVFAGQTSRLVRVVAGFENNPSYTARVLQNMGGQFDAIAVGAYFGPTPPERATYSASTTVDQVMNDMLTSIPVALNFIQEHRILADQYSTQLGRHVALVSYEGGPSLIGNNQPYQPTFVAASQDPRMYEAYRQFLSGARNAGLELFMQFEYTDRQVNNPFGVFGALNYQDQPLAVAPKYRALLDAVSGRLYQSPTTSTLLPVLLVLANQDFYFQEYNDTRQSLEQAGLRVQVAAAVQAPCVPHLGSGQGTGSGIVQPDLDLASVQAASYSAIVFIGGWGASEYQYAFQGTYSTSAYNGSAALRSTVNQLINDFVHQGKFVTAICHGVSVLAYARVDGHSLVEGHTVAAYNGNSPGFVLNGTAYAPNTLPDRWHIEANGGHVFVAGSIGDPRTDTDDVWVDGQIITAQNWNSARRFGQVIAEQVLARG